MFYNGFIFVCFQCVNFEFYDTEEVWTGCLRWALQGTLGSQRQPKGTDTGAYEKRGHTGGKGIHNEGREIIKTSPGNSVLLF